MQFLSWPDYLILASFLVISLTIGLYHSLTGGRQRTTAEFIMANRNLRVLPTAISLAVSYQSAILILGMTAELYSYGAQFLLLGLFCFVVNTIVVEEAIVPWIYPLKLVSVNEYVFIRFQSNSVRMFTSVLGIITSILYMGTAIYAPSAALESVTNFPIYLSVPVMSAVCIIYTALGGMRAVIWTDVFQCLTMLAGMMAIIIKGILVVGGINKVFEYLNHEGRLFWVDWDPDPTVRHTFWSIMIGGSLSWIPAYGISQAAVQRYSATETISKARMTIFLSIPGNVLMESIAALTALVVVSYYSMIKCDPLQTKDIHNENQLLPHFVMSLFGNSPGFPGLFLATLYGGALSSVSSALSGSAANCWEDIMKEHFSRYSETSKALINRILVIVFGVLATSVSFLVMVLPGPITQISSALCNSVIGSVFGIFLLGGISRHGNWKGALVGGFVSLAFTMWVSIGSMMTYNKYPSFPPISVDGCSRDDNVTSSALFTGMNSSLFTTKAPRIQSNHEMNWKPNHTGIDRFYCLSYCWYIMIATIITIVVGLLTSFIFREKDLEEAVEERLLIKYRGCGLLKMAEKEEEKLSSEKQTLDHSNGGVRKVLKETQKSMEFLDKEETKL